MVHHYDASGFRSSTSWSHKPLDVEWAGAMFDTLIAERAVDMSEQSLIAGLDNLYDRGRGRLPRDEHPS